MIDQVIDYTWKPYVNVSLLLHRATSNGLSDRNKTVQVNENTFIITRRKQ